MDAIATYAPAGGTERIAGTNRYATAEQVVQGFDPADIDVVYLASGEGFADALGGGAAAAAEGGALLLTAKGACPPRPSARCSTSRPPRSSSSAARRWSTKAWPTRSRPRPG